MQHTLLDFAGPGLLQAGIILFVIVMVIVVFLEVIVLLLLKYNSFNKSLLDSFIVNLVSLVLGFIFLVEVEEFAGNDASLALLISFFITYIVETVLLYFLNNKKPLKQTLLAGLLMNIVTYGILFIINL